MGNRQATGRPTVGRAAASDLVLPEAPAFRNLRVLAYALHDGVRLGWADGEQGRRLRAYLARWFPRADLGTPGGTLALAEALQRHHEFRQAEARLHQKGRGLMAGLHRARKEAAFARIADDFGYSCQVRC